MKANPSKEFFSNKSGMMQKKNSNLVINTNLDNAFDNRWAEIKIQGKNIASRSNHAATVFGNSLFIHGGYDVEKGIIGDFNEMDLSHDCLEFVWKKMNNTCNGKEIKLKSHTAVTYKVNLFLFGGQVSTNLSNNIVYVYDFITKNWKSVAPNIAVPRVDSHCAAVIGSKMYVYGGYISDKAEYMKDIYAFDLQNFTWEVVYTSGKSEQPQGRSNFSMVEFNQNLIIFGGTNGEKTLNDMWIFQKATSAWRKIEGKDTPEPRRGHSMMRFQNYLFLFGGIQNVTKQKNDIFIFQIQKSQWNKIHTTTNSVYDCSPTLKKGSKVASGLNQKQKSPESISPGRLSPQKSDRSDNPMHKILIENRQKKFLQRKRQLLKQFAQNTTDDKQKKRTLSPTTQSMVKTLQTIGNQQATHKELKQQIIYDESHRYIIGKKPCARDGQSVTLFNGKMYIFGGDRHLMAFNDLYEFDLTKGIKSLELYQKS